MPSLEILSQGAQAFPVLETSAKHLAELQVKVIYSRNCSVVPSVAELALGSAKIAEERTLKHASTSHFWMPAKEQRVV